MFKREEVIKILRQAQCIDSKFEIFGASTHRYRLNPPIRASFVRRAEEKYGFVLPEDYFRFITEVGDGGAGPDYGIKPFVNMLMEGKSPRSEKFREAYLYSLAKLFVPRQMMPDEVEDYAIATIEAYKRNPDRYFVYEKMDENDLCGTDGFYILGTHGCQWDFGLVLSGEKRGQVFDTDNEGAYGFISGSFDEFYQNWLDYISDTKKICEELERWRKRT